jgi:hypothetical protein
MPDQPTTVVNKYKDPYDVYIGRGSIWGNPFVIGRHGDRAAVIRRYETYFLSKPELQAQVHTLRDKRLGCFCMPKACHGEILAKYADLA